MGVLGFPDVVQTLAADAAREVCMQLSRARLVLRTVGPALAGLEEAGGAHFDLGQAAGKTSVDRGCSRGSGSGSSSHGGNGAGIGGAVDVSRSANRKQ